MKTFLLMVIICGAVLANAQFSGLRYEVIRGILETMQTDMLEIRMKIDQQKKDHDTLREEFAHQTTDLNSNLDHLREKNIKAFLTKADQLKNDQDKLNKELSGQEAVFNSKMDQLTDVLVTEFSCSQNGINGIYTLKLKYSQPLAVYCDDGWIVIQRQTNTLMNFNQTWTEYREGFGTLQDNYWMGLEKMHQITRTGHYELLVVKESFDGSQTRSKYKFFRVESTAQQYRLSLGNLFQEYNIDILANHHGAMFSTWDADNDNVSGLNCAKEKGCGWWFLNCVDGTPNQSGRFWMMIRAVK